MEITDWFPKIEYSIETNLLWKTTCFEDHFLYGLGENPRTGSTVVFIVQCTQNIAA